MGVQRYLALLVVAISLTGTRTASVESAQPRRAAIALVSVSHAIEGRMLTVSGFVRNLAAEPIGRLIIDVTGYGPRGDLVVTGTDGIPWMIPPSGTERFAVALPLDRQLVRDYDVRISLAPSAESLADARRGVDITLYRDHLQSLIRLSGEIQHGTLVARADAGGLPIRQVTVEATALVLNPLFNHFTVVPLTLDLVPDRTTRLFLGTLHAILLSLRVADVHLEVAWAD